MENKLQFLKWTKVDAQEKEEIVKAFLLHEWKMLAGYVLFLLGVVGLIVMNLVQQINIAYICVFSIIGLAAVMGAGNQLKTISQIKHSEFEKRDAFIRKLQYTGKVHRQVSFYEAEIKEQNQNKKVVFAKNYSKRKIKVNDKVQLVRIQKGQEICLFCVLA